MGIGGLLLAGVPGPASSPDPSWTPLAEEPRFGILPLVAATAQIVAGAAAVAFPLGLLTAIYLQYYAGPRTGAVLTAAVTPARRRPDGGVRIRRAELRDSRAAGDPARDRGIQRVLGLPRRPG